jgi:hypothetical protein
MRNNTAAEAKKYPFVENERSLDEFFRQWQRGTLPKPCWTHAAHVAVAACLAHEYAPGAALELTRTGIIHYNKCVGTENTANSGYHETLTRFWANTIGELVRGGKFASRLEAVRAALERFGEARGYHQRYYSFDVLGDLRARREWVAPDREPS